MLRFHLFELILNIFHFTDKNLKTKLMVDFDERKSFNMSDYIVNVIQTTDHHSGSLYTEITFVM